MDELISERLTHHQKYVVIECDYISIYNIAMFYLNSTLGKGLKKKYGKFHIGS